MIVPIGREEIPISQGCSGNEGHRAGMRELSGLAKGRVWLPLVHLATYVPPSVLRPPFRPVTSRMHNPAHPGEVLREYLPDGVTVTEAARRPEPDRWEPDFRRRKAS